MNIERINANIGNPRVSTCWRSGTVQHGGPSPDLGLHQPHRNHQQQGGGVGRPLASTFCSSSKGWKCKVSIKHCHCNAFLYWPFCSGTLFLQMPDIAQNLRLVFWLHCYSGLIFSFLNNRLSLSRTSLIHVVGFGPNW